MNRRDEFDDPEGFQSAFGKIAEAMEQGHTGLRRRGPLLGILTASVALFILFAVFWSTYPRGGADTPVAGPVPTIRADATPYKATPENPGGMDIPYKDSTVFEALRSNDAPAGSKIESLLPAAEQPIPKEQMFAGLKTEPIQNETAATAKMEDAADDITDKALDSGPVKSSSSVEQSGTILPEKQQVQTPAKVKEQTAPEKAVPASKTPVVPSADPVVRSASAEDGAAKTEPAAGNAKDHADTKAAAAPAAGTFYIQLGSVKTRDAAAAEWKKLQKQFPAELGSLTLRVQEASLGAKGTFYRIQGGTVAQASGKDICTALNGKRSGGCIVVAR